jgi:1,2-diacylglycerol 3-alpha-glucosyltransferase
LSSPHMPPRRSARSPAPSRLSVGAGGVGADAAVPSSPYPPGLAAEDDAEPAEAFNSWRKRFWARYLKAAADMGGLPLALLLFVPRTCLSFLVIAVAMLGRSVARIFQTASSYEKKANLRILIITDYLPPQTHGIAIRFSHYVHYMRRQGHEVQVFCTNIVRETESSFDHPNLPAIINPYNVKNKMAYTTGVKLAWYLGAKQWDLVHLVCPSNIPWPVLPVAAWRRIPIYVSHHVEMHYYIFEYVKVKWMAQFGYTMHFLITMLPTMWLAQVNAAPTLTFLNQYLSRISGVRKRIPSGVAHERFMVDSPSQVLSERKMMLQRLGYAPDANVCVLLMVQRLAPEKGTKRCLEALAAVPRKAGQPMSLDGKRPVHLMVAGEGPSRKMLEAFVKEHDLPVTFVGNLPNNSLPPLYRAADLFVTCSTSETYGLTVLEALACGTPVVLPHCGVFDELWIGRVPDTWIYTEGDDLDAVTTSLLSSLRSATSPGAKRHLVDHPIKASWEDATYELLEQYEEAIDRNMPHRQALSTIVSGIDTLIRTALVTALAWWCMQAYTKKLYAFALALVDDFID